MKVYVIVIVLFLCTTCTTKTQVYVSTFSTKYDNGRSIDVKREDRYTRWTGYFSKIDYGQTNSFSYSFNIHPDDYEWEGLMNQVPLELIFCSNDTYLKVTERIVRYDSLYSAGEFKDTTLYFKNVDDRYFFNLFGDQYFIAADSTDYQERSIKCKQVLIPNL
jgi:hypothetical protein